MPSEQTERLRNSAPEPCTIWNSAVQIGQLDPKVIDEASGLEVSPAFPDRLYHINDSGDGGHFYLTDTSGGNTQRVTIEGFAPQDTEDLSLGPCGVGAGRCLFIADIGDNNRVRDFVEVVVIEERENFGQVVSPSLRLRIRYPAGPEDAESLAVHPNGDIFIITKSADYTRLSVQPSKVYRLARNVWIDAENSVLTPVLAGVWDLTRISSDIFSGSLPTAADISEDGNRLLLLTYTNAFEFVIDSWERLDSTTEMVAEVDYREIDLEVLEQQESIAYIPQSAGFRYETEAAASTGPPRILEVQCLR